MSQNLQPQQPKRSIVTRTPFFLPVSVPFTSTVNETQSALYSNPTLTGDLEIVGMTTDLENVTGQFSVNNKPVWSSTRIPLSVLFGKPGGPKPVRWLEEPLTLRQGERLRCDLLNAGGEDAGTLVFVARHKGDEGQRYEIPVGGVDDVLVIDSGFTGSAADDKRVPSDKSDDDFVLYGLHTNLADATVIIKGGRNWMEDPVPIWAIAGNATAEHAVQRLKDPYLIPAKMSLVVEFINVGAEASGQLFITGKRCQPAQKG